MSEVDAHAACIAVMSHICELYSNYREWGQAEGLTGPAVCSSLSRYVVILGSMGYPLGKGIQLDPDQWKPFAIPDPKILVELYGVYKDVVQQPYDFETFVEKYLKIDYQRRANRTHQI
jgi:hypothetical protein